MVHGSQTGSDSQTRKRNQRAYLRGLLFRCKITSRGGCAQVANAAHNKQLQGTWITASGPRDRQMIVEARVVDGVAIAAGRGMPSAPIMRILQGGKT